jgi:hypothetical protein
MLCLFASLDQASKAPFSNMSEYIRWRRTVAAAPVTRGSPSDFVSLNLDGDFAALIKERWLSDSVHLGLYLFAGEGGGNGITDLRQFTRHKMAMPTSVLAMNIERVKRSHI